MIVHLKKKKNNTDAKDTTNFIINLQVGMSWVTKK